MEPFYIGYPMLEEWLTVIDKKQPVFGCLVMEMGEMVFNQRSTDLIIIITQPGGDNLVHYCRLIVGCIKDGWIYNEDGFRRMMLAEQAWKIVQDWLNQQGLTVLPGIIATPKNMRFLEGWAKFLEFDPKTQKYINKAERNPQLDNQGG
jgi:hypothetical protein